MVQICSVLLTIYYMYSQTLIQRTFWGCVKMYVVANCMLYQGFTLLSLQKLPKVHVPALFLKMSHMMPTSMSVCLFIYLPVCLSAYQLVCLSICLSACLSVSLSACQPVCLPACLFVYLPVCLLVCLPASICIAVCLPAYMSVTLPTSQPVCLFVCMPTSMSVCLSACLSTYQYVCLSICLPASLPDSLLASLHFDFLFTTSIRIAGKLFIIAMCYFELPCVRYQNAVFCMITPCI